MKTSHLLCALSLLAAVLLCAPGALSAADAVASPDAASASPWSLDWGLDLRARYHATNYMPNAAYGESVKSDFLRMRTRVWTKAEYGDDFGVFLRLANEFRDYHDPKSMSAFRRFPDVLYIDALYADFRNLLDGLDLRIGRQDLAYGGRRIISDGTPGDGSRSIYFDAVKASWHVDEARTLDAFVLVIKRSDWLPTAGEMHRNGHRPTDYDVTGFQQSEYGAGLYWQDRSDSRFGWDAYYVAKTERRDRHSRYRSEGRHAETHTFGIRVLPQFTETLRGEAEAAIQLGTGDLLAGQLYGGLTYAPQNDFQTTAAVLYLSGDRNGERGKHAWHSVFNREGAIGEAVIPMFTESNFTNLLYPHLAAKALLGKRLGTLSAQAGPMFTPTRENGHGNRRGLYAQVNWALDLEKLLDNPHAKDLTLEFLGEAFNKGNFFNHGSRHTALFGRVQLAWKY